MAGGALCGSSSTGVWVAVIYGGGKVRWSRIDHMGKVIRGHKERWFGCHSAAMDVGTLPCVISHMTPTPYEQGATAIQGLCQHTLEGESRLSVVSIHPPSGVRPLYAA
jgi:hypothetical protein